MSKNGRHGHLSGAVEMVAFIAYTQRESARSTCIMEWYYEREGIPELVAALERFKERQAMPAIYTFAKRACGE